MIEELGSSERWFRMLMEGAVQEIEQWVQRSSQYLEWRQPPMEHTALSAIIKDRSDEAREIIELLLKNKANPNAVDKLGQSAIFYSVAFNRVDLCRVLLKEPSTNLQIIDDFGQNVIEYAQALGRGEIVEMMREEKMFRKAFLQMEDEDQPMHQDPQQSLGKQQRLKEVFKVERMNYELCCFLPDGQMRPLDQDQIDELQRNIEQRGTLIKDMRNPINIPNRPFELKQTWRNLCMKIIDRLCKLSDSFWFKHNSQVWRVHEQIDEREEQAKREGREVGCYNPQIDLFQIKFKLEHYFYKKVEEVTADVQSLWSISMQKYGDNHDLTKAGKALFDAYFKLALQFNIGQYENRIEIS